jgi:hypothetical protein
VARRLDRMLIGLIFVGAGIITISVALLDVRSTWTFVERAQRAQGVVTGLYAGAAHPKVGFTTPAGDQITIAGTGFTRHRTGDQVTVLYLPDAPEHAKLDEPGVLWFSACMTSVLGLVLFLAGVIKLR